LGQNAPFRSPVKANSKESTLKSTNHNPPVVYRKRLVVSPGRPVVYNESSVVVPGRLVVYNESSVVSPERLVVYNESSVVSPEWLVVCNESFVVCPKGLPVCREYCITIDKEKNMAGRDWIPRSDEDFEEFVKQYVVTVKTNTAGATPLWTHIPDERVNELTNSYGVWHITYDKLKGAHTSGDVIAKNEARDASYDGGGAYTVKKII
jgi:hypothetical protein